MQPEEAKWNDDALWNDEAQTEDLQLLWNPTIAKQLLSVEPILSFTDSTALHLAAEQGLGKAVARLLAVCPTLIGQVEWGAEDCGTALHSAARSGYTDIVAQLLAVNPLLIDVRGACNWTAFHCAAARGQTAVVAQLLAINPALIEATIPSCGWTALHLAADRGHEDVVALLLAANPASIDAKADDGSTVLHRAVDRGQDGVTAQLLAARPALLDAVINDADGFLALQNAVQMGHEEAVARLLTTHPNLIRETSEEGWTAFHFAAFFGREKVMSQLIAAVIRNDHELLSRRSAEFSNSHTVSAGSTALHVAAIRGHDAMIAQLLAACPTLIDVLNDHGQTCLHCTMHGSTVEYLIEYKPDLVRAVDAHGNTCLHSMALGLCSAELIERVWKMNPAALLAINDSLQTPFHIAVKAGNDCAMDVLQWSLTFDEVVSVYDECELSHVARLKPLTEKQCEKLSVALLLPDLVAVVIKYLGFDDKPWRLF